MVVYIIRLTPEEREEAYKFDSFEDFLYTLEDKYGFKVSQSQWVAIDNLDVYHYEKGSPIDHRQ